MNETIFLWRHFIVGRIRSMRETQLETARVEGVEKQEKSDA